MKRIRLSEGGGGEESWRLIRELFLRYFENPVLSALEDSALLQLSSKVAFTTDAFTVKPLFFRGGDIGKLAVAGTVNDLAVMGAKPLYLSASFIIEEGFPYEDLQRIVESMAQTAKEAGVLIVAGDTKVVPSGQADGLFITTSGIGRVVYDGLSCRSVKEGDAIILSGPIGDHGACVLAQREGFDFGENFGSDCQPLWDLVEHLLRSGVEVHAMRDPTRGGLSAVLHEWANASGVSFLVQEDSIPVRQEVLGICEFLGLEPYHLACEGRIVVAVRGEDAERALEVLREHPKGREASLIGYAVRPEGRPSVFLRTSYGTRRFLEPPAGELLPRIC
ncbi:MAG: hydrogenase expression/formation protein HypE [Aquificaceae bacterium]|jgi:hydrogenase expression/formation protein HypE|uniref:hydrogenase expression/formation protein HypE n=1 Tax=Hydrogenobacter sp. Uz 6-8 TaxID=3384828 RepID=UPI0030A1F332